MSIIPMILQILALMCLAFAALGMFSGPPSRPAWGWLGLFLWLLSLMVTSIQLHPVHG